jgi:cell division protein ZapA
MQYKQRYTDKDVQDFLAMVALQYVIKLLEQENKNDTAPILDAVKELNDKLDTVLSEEI